MVALPSTAPSTKKAAAWPLPRHRPGRAGGSATPIRPGGAGVKLSVRTQLHEATTRDHRGGQPSDLDDLR